MTTVNLLRFSNDTAFQASRVCRIIFLLTYVFPLKYEYSEKLCKTQSGLKRNKIDIFKITQGILFNFKFPKVI